MFVASNPTIVSDYLTGLPNLSINREYQRGGGIWPNGAKSALIETIVLGFPMPAMYVHQRYNTETKKPYKELVDGQQRTEALRQFHEGKLKLSGTNLNPRLRGRVLTTLEDDDYQRFMSYSLPIFLFTDSSSQDVREAFRRLNSFNAVLTPEEIRHSTYHGPFKWFIHSLAARISETLLKWDTFTPAQVNRMKDTALVAEIVFAYFNGIRTTKAQQLNSLYTTFEKKDDFDEGATLGAEIENAFRTLASFDWFVSSPLTKPYQVWLLILAIMHAKKAIVALSDLVEGGTGLRAEAEIRTNLGELIEALEGGESLEESPESNDSEAADSGKGSDDADVAVDGNTRLSEYQAFVVASSEKTNTADTRKTRFMSFMGAVARQ
jgi:Protein of unknown function DUF262